MNTETEEIETEEEQAETDYNFPQEPAKPAPNAMLNDWRFEACWLSMKTEAGTYSNINLNNNKKIIGKRQNFVVCFALAIPTPANIETQEI